MPPLPELAAVTACRRRAAVTRPPLLSGDRERDRADDEGSIDIHTANGNLDQK